MLTSIYTSCEAACLAEMQSNGEEVEGQTALNAMMAEVPKNLKKIAGKSLPIEVGCRRASHAFSKADKCYT